MQIQERAEAASFNLDKVAVALKGGAAMIGGLFLHFPPALATLGLMMAIDYLTGLIASAIEKKWAGHIARNGLCRKVAVGAAAIAGFFVSGLIPNVEVAGFDLGKIDVGSAIAVAFSISEFISILENLGRCGYKLPGPVRSILKKLKQVDEQTGPSQQDNSNPAGSGTILEP